MICYLQVEKNPDLALSAEGERRVNAWYGKLKKLDLEEDRRKSFAVFVSSSYYKDVLVLSATVPAQ